MHTGYGRLENKIFTINGVAYKVVKIQVEESDGDKKLILTLRKV